MELKQLLPKVETLTRIVGQFIKKEGANFDIKKIEKKGFNDLVSYVDKQAEEQLVSGLSILLPDSGFITEEGTVAQVKKDFIWIIDPLDGTTNFTHGLPVFSVSIALMHNEDLVLGVVYEINKDEMFTAIKGEGAYCNGLPIQVSTINSLGESLIATGFPYYDFDKINKYMKILNHLMQHTHGIRRMGSAAVDLAYVACGRFEAFYEYNLNAWDVAAGILLVQEAGGKVTTFDGDNNCLFGREILASGNIHKELIEVIKQNW